MYLGLEPVWLIFLCVLQSHKPRFMCSRVLCAEWRRITFPAPWPFLHPLPCCYFPAWCAGKKLSSVYIIWVSLLHEDVIQWIRELSCEALMSSCPCVPGSVTSYNLCALPMSGSLQTVILGSGNWGLGRLSFLVNLGRTMKGIVIMPFPKFEAQNSHCATHLSNTGSCHWTPGAAGQLQVPYACDLW